MSDINPTTTDKIKAAHAPSSSAAAKHDAASAIRNDLFNAAKSLTLQNLTTLSTNMLTAAATVPASASGGATILSAMATYLKTTAAQIANAKTPGDLIAILSQNQVNAPVLQTTLNQALTDLSRTQALCALSGDPSLRAFSPVITDLIKLVTKSIQDNTSFTRGVTLPFVNSSAFKGALNEEHVQFRRAAMELDWSAESQKRNEITGDTP